MSKNLAFSSSLKSMMVLIISAAVFAVAGWLCFIFFRDNSYPVNFRELTSYDWAQKFLNLFIFSTIVSIALNFLIIFLNILGAFRTKSAWVLLLILNIFIGIGFSVALITNYPDESSCYIIASVVFMLQQIMTFFFTTMFSSDIWRSGFFPFGG